MATLLIDNYDSFTYNLVQAVAGITGQAPIVVRNDEKNWEQIERLDFDSVIISPGPGRPENPRDFGVSAQAIAEAKVPVLGVCLGHQGIAHHFGGSVVRAPEPVHGRSAEIIHDGDELFAGIPEHFSAIRYHSLIVGEPLPRELTKIAWTADGVVMALRHRTRPIWGVQFHPESICTEYGTTILRNFLAERQAHARRTIHVHALEIPLSVAPETLFRCLFSRERYAFWLDSSMTSENRRFSFMGAGDEILQANALSELDNALRGIDVQAPPLPFQFTGGYVGYLGYPSKRHRSPFPDAYLLRVDRFLAIDHLKNAVWIVSCGEPDQETEKRIVALKDCSPPSLPSMPVEFTLATEREEYLRLIAECRSRIAAGESYEICLTNELRIRTDVSPLAYYENLRKLNPAPHSAFLHFDDIDVACSSPERFLRIDTEGNVESRPIKGTSRRGETPEEDDALRDSLAASEKNRAENLMIVDLARNDLGRVCLPGSVHVPQMMQVETYATVHQLVSTIAAKLAPGKTVIDCIRAAFPGGSMTGAPKLRTLEILDELEPQARGIYSGSIGYVGYNGAADLNIVIRTAVFHRGVATIGVGGAIVYQSRPEDEWDEMLLKAQAPLSAFSSKL
ncbi:MAG TPA: aminodeoxychorismate synthase component I [Bryobacteraceae bacterium]|nr:aminodeoxychorismate synthase component I [Bryobacteraceae bacterium]